MRGFTNALKGIGGQYELNRLVGGFGGFVYVIAANAFVAYEVFWQGKDFDITAYCLAFPGGLAVVAGGTAAAISLKDRNVASAKVVEDTGNVPTKGPGGTQKVEVVNTPADPVPTETVAEPAAAPEPSKEGMPSYAQ